MSGKWPPETPSSAAWEAQNSAQEHIQNTIPISQYTEIIVAWFYNTLLEQRTVVCLVCDEVEAFALKSDSLATLSGVAQF